VGETLVGADTVITVAVGRAVLVAVGTNAVWVWNMPAAIVSAMLAATVALISGMGVPVTEVEQADNTIPESSHRSINGRIMIHLIRKLFEHGKTCIELLSMLFRATPL
jgi:hypothetical protein